MDPPPAIESKTAAEPQVDIQEAKRIAAELEKLQRDGAFKGADDPEPRFCAQVIHTFGGTYEGVRHPVSDTE